MSASQRRAALILTGLALCLAGCMTGRSSLLATQGAAAAPARLAPGDPPGTPVGAAYPVGPSRSAAPLASSSLGAARLSALQAPAPAVGGLRLSSGLAVATAPIAASARTGVSITPTLAPAAAVGASVAAVAQPLAVAAKARVRTRTVLKPVRGLAGQVQTGLGVSLHAGG